MRRLQAPAVLFVTLLAAEAYADQAADSASQGTPSTSTTPPSATMPPPPPTEAPVVAQPSEASSTPPAAVPPPPAAPPAPAMGLSSADRMLIDQQIDDLVNRRDEKYSLGGPIATMAVGGAFTITGLILTLYGAVFTAVPDAGYTDFQQAGTTMMIVGASSAVVGAGLVIGGVVWLGDRRKQRRPYNEQIEDLERQLEFSSLRLEPLVFENGGGAMFSARF